MKTIDTYVKKLGVYVSEHGFWDQEISDWTRIPIYNAELGFCDPNVGFYIPNMGFYIPNMGFYYPCYGFYQSFLSDPNLDHYDPINVDEFIRHLRYDHKLKTRAMILSLNKYSTPRPKKAANCINPSAVTRCVLEIFGHERDTMYSMLMFCSHYNKLDLFEELLKSGANRFYRNNYGATVMNMLAKRGQVEMANLLLNGLDPYLKNFLINTPNFKGWTPLMAATNRGNEL